MVGQKQNVFFHDEQAECDSGAQNDQSFVQWAHLHASTVERLCVSEQNLKSTSKLLTRAELLNSQQMRFYNLCTTLKTNINDHIKCYWHKNPSIFCVSSWEVVIDWVLFVCCCLVVMEWGRSISRSSTILTHLKTSTPSLSCLTDKHMITVFAFLLPPSVCGAPSPSTRLAVFYPSVSSRRPWTYQQDESQACSCQGLNV